MKLFAKNYSGADEMSYYHTHRGAREYQGKHHTGFHDRQITELRRLIPESFPQNDLKLLEIGSGHAPDYPSLVNAGFDYTGIDSSQAMIDLARQTHGSAIELGQKDMRNLDFPPRSFHAVWAAAALHHISRDELGSVLKQIRESIVPGGVAYFSVRGGDDNDRTNAKTGITYIHHSTHAFNKALQKAMFRVEEIGTEIIDNPVPGDGSATNIEYTFAYVRTGLEEFSNILANLE